MRRGENRRGWNKIVEREGMECGRKERPTEMQFGWWRVKRGWRVIRLVERERMVEPDGWWRGKGW